VGISQTDLQRFATSDYGYYSWLAKRMFCCHEGRGQVIRIGRFEHLQEDLVNILRDLDCRVTPAMVTKLDYGKPINFSVHGDSSYYYDATLKEEVGRQEETFYRRLSESFSNFCTNSPV
jgi:hypothetical protein